MNMERSYIWKVALVLTMMVFSALFSGTETAYSSVNKLRLKNYESQGNKKAAKSNTPCSLCYIGNTGNVT